MIWTATGAAFVLSPRWNSNKAAHGHLLVRHSFAALHRPRVVSKLKSVCGKERPWVKVGRLGG